MSLGVKSIDTKKPAAMWKENKKEWQSPQVILVVFMHATPHVNLYIAIKAKLRQTRPTLRESPLTHRRCVPPRVRVILRRLSRRCRERLSAYRHFTCQHVWKSLP